MRKAPTKHEIQNHWNKVYEKETTSLGWYESDHAPMLKLIEKSEIDKDAHIFLSGAGATTLVDELILRGYTNLTVNDISAQSLAILQNRNPEYPLRMVIEDLRTPELIKDIAPVDLWIDRAVLHFLTEKEDQQTYSELIQEKLSKHGQVILAEFAEDGATKCSGLPVNRFNLTSLKELMGTEMQDVVSFNFDYIMPSGGKRPYIYSLFKRV